MITRLAGLLAFLSVVQTYGASPAEERLSRVAVFGKPLAKTDNIIMGAAFTDADFELLREFPNLKRVAIDSRDSRARVSRRGLATLRDLPNLEILDISETPVSDNDLETIAEIPRLRSLFLTRTKVTGERIGSHLSGATQLRDLTLVGLQTFQDPEKLKNLESLIISGSGLQEEALVNFSALQNLRFLGVDKASITDAGLSQLGTLPVLDELSLDGSSKIRGAGLSGITAPHLRAIGLSYTAFDDAAAGTLKRFPELKEIALHGTKIGDAGVCELAADLPQITSLSLANTDITDKGAACIRKMQNLTFLGIQSTLITQSAADSLKRALPKIKHFVWQWRVRYQ